MVPDFVDGVGDAVRFILLPPSFKNRFNSDIDPCLVCNGPELSSFKWNVGSLWPPNLLECFLFSPCAVTSTALLEERGMLFVKLGERLCFEFSALNLNLWSIASRFFD